MAIKVMRDFEMIEIEIEDMKKGDVFALCDGSVKTCTSEPFFDDEENCYYVHAGIDLFHELLIGDMKEVDFGNKHDLLGKEVKIDNKEGEITNILGTQFFEVSFFDLNEGKTSIHYKDIDKYLIPSKRVDISLDGKLKDAARRVSKGSEKGSERQVDMEL